MDVTVDCGALAEALAHVMQGVEAKMTIPILGTVLLTAREQGFTLRASCLERECAATVPAEVRRAGAVAVPAARLAALVRAWDQGAAVLVTARDGRLAAKAGRARAELSVLDAGDYPGTISDAAEGDVAFTMPAADLARMIETTRMAVSTEETRYYLNGIFLHVEGEKWVAVATDGHRLARTEVRLPVGAAGVPAVIVPRHALRAIAAIAGEAGEELVGVTVGSRSVCVSFGERVVATRLIDGTFPDYKRVYAQSAPRVFATQVEHLAASLARVVGVAGRDKVRVAELRLGEDAIEVWMRGGDGKVDSAVDETPAERTKAGTVIGFNAAYLAEMLASYGDGAVEAYQPGEGGPVVFRAPGDAGRLHVVMPMRV